MKQIWKYAISRFVIRTASGALLLALCAIHASAMGPQMILTTNSITGTVTDTTGAVVPGATVTATNENTGVSVTTTTNSMGSYSTPPIDPGTYKIIVSAPRMKTFTQEHFEVQTNAALTFNPKLQPGFDPGVIQPKNIEKQEQALITTSQTFANPSPTLLNGINCGQDYVRVSLSGVLGPMGYVPSPSLSSASQLTGVDANLILQGKSFYYPSIILYISAVPVVCVGQPPTNQTDADKQVNSIEQSSQETNRNPEWLDASFSLTATDDKDKAIDIDCTDDKSIKILQILPQQTVAGLKNQPLADTATAINSIAGALASFYPGVQAQATGATQALNVVFQDLFPPQPIAYQYSYQSGNCHFGWFFRPNPNSTAGNNGEASILGTQQGIVLLKVSNKINKLQVSGLTLSAWNKNPNQAYPKNKLYLSPLETINFTLNDPASANYDGITDLTLFPALISKTQAEQILHINNDNDWNAVVALGQLKTFKGADDTYVTNASLSAFLGLGSSAVKGDTTNNSDTQPRNGNGAGGGAAPGGAATPGGTAATVPTATPAPAAKPTPKTKPGTNPGKSTPKTKQK